MKYQCNNCGLPVQTEQCGDTLHVKPCPICAHKEWSRGYDEAFDRFERAYREKQAARRVK